MEIFTQNGFTEIQRDLSAPKWECGRIFIAGSQDDTRFWLSSYDHDHFNAEFLAADAEERLPEIIETIEQTVLFDWWQERGEARLTIYDGFGTVLSDLDTESIRQAQEDGFLSFRAGRAEGVSRYAAHCLDYEIKPNAYEI